MEFWPRSDVGETVPGPRACPGLDWDGNKVLRDCHKVVQDFEHEGAPCVPTPGHKTGPSQVLNQLGQADVVVISLWEMVGVSFPGFPVTRRAACLWTVSSRLISLLLLGSHIGEAYSMAGRTMVLYAVSRNVCGQEQRFLSRKANCRWALAAVALMCGSQLRCSLMVTPSYLVFWTRSSSLPLIE